MRPDDIARLMVNIRDLRASLRDTLTELEHEFVASMNGDKKLEVDGLGEFAVKRKTSRTGWDHDALISAVVARIVDEPSMVWDPTTGEMLPPNAIGANVARRLRDAISFGAGKVTGLRALGLDPDEYCHEEDAGYGVQLPTTRTTTRSRVD